MQSPEVAQSPFKQASFAWRHLKRTEGHCRNKDTLVISSSIKGK